MNGPGDPIFSEPRLAEIYDAFDGDRNDLTPYLVLARELGAEHVIDVGCGTGSLALLLAAQGFSVVGVEPAKASLDVARRKGAATSISWIHGDATTLPALSADLAVMTGNVAQVFLSDEDWMSTLHGIRRALRMGGYLAFETRRQERAIWEEWAIDTAPVAIDVPGVGRVEQRRLVTRVELPIVAIRHTYRFASDGAVLTSDSALRFRSRSEIERSLEDCGFAVVDVRDAPDRPGREHVFIARSR